MLTIDFEVMGLNRGERVLDIGCGEGRHTWEACKQSDCFIVAADIDEASLKKARYVLCRMDEQGESRGNWHVIQANAMMLPFKDGIFDRIICSEVLEHIPDDEKSMKELVRILKDGGVMAISVPTYLTETIYWGLSRDYHNNPGGHIRIYKARELIALLHQHDLHVYAEQRKHALHSIYWLLRCLFGIKNEKTLIPALYYKFLVWDMKTKSKFFRWLDEFFNFLFPKSLVLYTRKSVNAS